jgi:death-on-curing protein
MYIEIIYFDIEHAIKTHDWVINHSGGKSGVKDISAIESILAHIQNDDYYPEFIDKLTHLVFGVNKIHAFIDGNKRTSLALGAYFLEINGYDYCVKYFMSELENIAVWVADNDISKEFLHEILFSIIYEDEYSEELKLKIAEIKINKGHNHG